MEYGKDYNTAVRDQIPFNIDSIKLLKDISKEIRHAERYINQLNPPKPERESKRKRKRPVNKDFDYSLSPKYEFLPPTPKPEYARPSPLKLTLPKTNVFPYETNSIPQPLQLTSSTWDPGYPRPEETTAIHRGGTVLKIKFGSKDLIQPSDALNFGLTDPTKSIYDFHDESDRDEEFSFTIDESPKRQKKPVTVPKPKAAKKRNRLNMDGNPELPQNGIESLLKASALTTGEHPGRASPSTQEAIAGMLSIGQTFVQPKGRARRSSQSPSPEETINNVHQDEDYIYPSLDNSDDEDVHIFKPRGRSKVDEAWNPKARVGPLLPKVNRPAREGTKRQAVEKVLEAAAARRALDNPEKVYHKLKIYNENNDNNLY
ncbi:hypothetical protein HHI36_023060 [Cryptolaemus montrouzieri]|uniref:Uncharacterized protein n=1 Tax=Cryptolaemus montrouzieri TaxID=559131 RepID=A0ABD2PF90_9CUCU